MCPRPVKLFLVFPANLLFGQPADTGCCVCIALFPLHQTIERAIWVRTESATWCKRWSDLCSLPFQFSINRSLVEFMDDGGLASITRFIEQISKQGLTGNNFVFEITEGMLLN